MHRSHRHLRVDLARPRAARRVGPSDAAMRKAWRGWCASLALRLPRAGAGACAAPATRSRAPPAPSRSPPSPRRWASTPQRSRWARSSFTTSGCRGAASVACASCHDLARGGDDGRAAARAATAGRSTSIRRRCFNAALNFRLNWRGNFRDLEAQNEAALLDPRLMGADWATLLPRLRADPEYARGFRGRLRPPAAARGRARRARRASSGRW